MSYQPVDEKDRTIAALRNGVGLLKRENARLKGELVELRKYLYHRPSCMLDSAGVCTCGLDALVQRRTK